MCNMLKPSYPDDKYNRLWQPFSDQKHPPVTSRSSIKPSNFWNIPPAKVFVEGFTASKGKPLQILWPPFPLPATKYYVALYFQDDRSPSPSSWRAFGVSINGVSFSRNLNVSTNGVMVYSGQWPLSGQTQITLTPAKDSPMGGVINAGEVFQVIPLGGSTNFSDGNVHVFFCLLHCFVYSVILRKTFLCSNCNGRSFREHQGASG